jgi:hypothetical protein
MKQATVSVGQEIFYGGDMANASGYGKVAELKPSQRFTDQVVIAMDDGRSMTIPTVMIMDEYHGNGGIRFCTIEAYRKWYDEAYGDAMRRYAEAQRRHEVLLEVA